MKLYKNRIDIFHYVMYAFFSITCVVFCIFVAMGDARVISKIATIVLFLLLESYLTVLMFKTSYYFTKDKLICRFGPVELNYPYANIKSVVETRSLSFHINTTFKCIKIKMETGRVVRVSPKDKEEFLKELGRHGFLIIDKKKKVSGKKWKKR